MARRAPPVERTLMAVQARLSQAFVKIPRIFLAPFPLFICDGEGGEVPANELPKRLAAR